jgi:hypothetical protein
MLILVLYANVEHHVKKIYVLAALIMSNIVLNNYSKNKNNTCQHEKRSTKKKLTTLNN